MAFLLRILKLVRRTTLDRFVRIGAATEVLPIRPAIASGGPSLRSVNATFVGRRRRRLQRTESFDRLAFATAMEFLVLGEAMRPPTFLDEIDARKVLKHGFQMVVRLQMTAQSPIAIELCKKGATTTLIPPVMLQPQLRIIRPIRTVFDSSRRVRPTIGHNDIRVHRWILG